MDRLLVVSVDSHAQAPPDAWPKYLDPNFHEYLDWAKAIGDGLHRPVLWWQVPFGVPSNTPGGTAGHYRDVPGRRWLQRHLEHRPRLRWTARASPGVRLPRRPPCVRDLLQRLQPPLPQRGVRSRRARTAAGSTTRSVTPRTDCSSSVPETRDRHRRNRGGAHVDRRPRLQGHLRTRIPQLRVSPRSSTGTGSRSGRCARSVVSTVRPRRFRAGAGSFFPEIARIKHEVDAAGGPTPTRHPVEGRGVRRRFRRCLRAGRWAADVRRLISSWSR